MTITYFPFDEGQGANVTEFQWQKMAQHWLKTGVISSVLNKLQVAGDSTGMQVKIKSGAAWIRGHYFESDAEETLAIGSADVSNPRIDRVIIRLDSNTNTVNLFVLQGVPAVNPAPPVLIQNSNRWEIPLAQVRVNAGVSTITAGNVTDDRTFVDFSDRFKLTDNNRDGFYFGIEEDVSTGDFALNTYNPDGSYRNNVCRFDINGITSFPAQTFVVAESSITQTVSDNTPTKINFGSETKDTQSEFLSSRFTAKKKGIYLVRGNIEWATNTNGRSFMRIYKNGVTDAVIVDRLQSGEKYLYGSEIIELNAGEYIEFYAFHDDAGTASITLNKAGIKITKLA